MTDWMEDLRRLQAFEQAPEVGKAKDATKFPIGFLYHLIPHLNASRRLLLDDIPDAFEGECPLGSSTK